MEGVEDIPGTALHEGIQWDWESFPEYLDALERMPRAVDVGAMVPHAALRAYVMEAREHGDATADDLAAMTAILRASIEAGALGFSTGRTHGHRSVHGEPVPGTFAAVDELDALSEAMDAAGRGVFQVVPTGIGGIEGGDPEGLDGDRAAVDARPRVAHPQRAHVPGDGEQRRPRRVAPLVRRRAPRERGRREPAAAGRRPLLRRAAGSPVAHEPVQVLARLRDDRRPAARRARRAAAPCRGA